MHASQALNMLSMHDQAHSADFQHLQKTTQQDIGSQSYSLTALTSLDNANLLQKVEQQQAHSFGSSLLKEVYAQNK